MSYRVDALRACMLLLATAVLLAPGAAFARASTGIGSPDTIESGGEQPTCSNGLCHGPRSNKVEVVISGPSQLAPNERGSYSVRLRDAQNDTNCSSIDVGNCQKGAGLNIVLFDGGSLKLVDSNTMFFESTGEVTHLENANIMPIPLPGDGSVGDWRYNFDVKAPSSVPSGGMITIAAAMNAFNQSVDAVGDLWNNASLQVAIVSAPPNDDSDDAIALDEGKIMGTLVGASNDGDASVGEADQPDVWYAFTASEDGTLFANTCGTFDMGGLDTVLSLHSGSPGTIGNELDANDNAMDPGGSDPNGCVGLDTSGLDSALALEMSALESVVIRVSRANDSTDGDFMLSLAFEAAPPDEDADGVADEEDNCPTVANGPDAGPNDQLDTDNDGVGDVCDNCVLMSNPRDTGGGANPVFTGNQLDSDADGFGNACDGDFDQKLPIVGLPDLTQMRLALGQFRDGNTCPTDAGTLDGPCAEFDMDSNIVPIIGLPDLTRFRLIQGNLNGPKCAACPLPNLP